MNETKFLLSWYHVAHGSVRSLKSLIRTVLITDPHRRSRLPETLRLLLDLEES